MASHPDLPHIGIFPFMSKGHTIPLLHLARIIHRRHLATLTFFTTPLNAPFIRRSLADTDAAVLEIPFPDNVPQLPSGVESTDNLPSMSLFLPFVQAIKQLRPQFERALESLPTTSFLISDGFLDWTNDSAAKFGIPRVAFYGMSTFAMTVAAVISRDRPHAGLTSYHEPFTVPGFPHLRITKADLYNPSEDRDAPGPLRDFVVENHRALQESHGLIVNSFYELEATYLDRWNNEIGPKAWCVGPVCLARQESGMVEQQPGLKEWLDSRAAMDRPVLYVAFGTQAEVSAAQLKEIAIGLERSGLDFLWVVRGEEADMGDGFEERTAGRGRVVKLWVDQLAVLQHDSVKGFMSHCGWNSVMESVCTAVPILAWPMMADQGVNAKLVAEEMKIGLRIQTSDGTMKGWVSHEEIEKKVKELLVGEKGREAAKHAAEAAAAAMKATTEGGSSWRTLEVMIDELRNNRMAHEQSHVSRDSVPVTM